MAIDEITVALMYCRLHGYSELLMLEIKNISLEKSEEINTNFPY